MQQRIEFLLVFNSGERTVPRIYDDVGGHCQQTSHRRYHLNEVSVVKICPAVAVSEQRIAGKQDVAQTERNAARTVSGGVDYFKSHTALFYDVAASECQLRRRVGDLNSTQIGRGVKFISIKLVNINSSAGFFENVGGIYMVVMSVSEEHRSKLQTIGFESLDYFVLRLGRVNKDRFVRTDLVDDINVVL